MAFAYVMFNKETIKPYLSRTIWWHRSAKLDYQYFFVISILKTAIIFPLMVSVGEIAYLTLTTLQDGFGYQIPLNVNRTVVIILYTLSLFVLGDFTRYWLHRWLHSSRFLWQFHQVHHSAQVLTPFTFYRVHPVENILFGLRYALTTGIVTGFFIYWFGARLQIIDILGVNLFIFVSLLLGANLRHSPVYFRFPTFLEKWLISPAQHQLHHTPDGLRKNYAGILAIWDRLFGTLKLSNTPKPEKFGLPENNPMEQLGIIGLLCFPFFMIFNVGQKRYDSDNTFETSSGDNR